MVLRPTQWLGLALGVVLATGCGGKAVIDGLGTGGSGGSCSSHPACDPGDQLVPACPANASCYTVEGCDGTIECSDSALPAHGCPTAEPSPWSPCGEHVGLYCWYDAGSGCFDTYECFPEGTEGESVWQYGGQACPD